MSAFSSMVNLSSAFFNLQRRITLIKESDKIITF